MRDGDAVADNRHHMCLACKYHLSQSSRILSNLLFNCLKALNGELLEIAHWVLLAAPVELNLWEKSATFYKMSVSRRAGNDCNLQDGMTGREEKISFRMDR